MMLCSKEVNASVTVGVVTCKLCHIVLETRPPNIFDALFSLKLSFLYLNHVKQNWFWGWHIGGVSPHPCCIDLSAVICVAEDAIIWWSDKSRTVQNTGVWWQDNRPWGTFIIVSRNIFR